MIRGGGNKDFMKAQQTITRQAIREGRIKKHPCEQCGGKIAVAHHPNYFKVFEVVWLCASCHTNLHARMKLLEKETTISEMARWASPSSDSHSKLTMLRKLRAESVMADNKVALIRIDKLINRLSLTNP